jgi:hypothetical protein
LRVKVAEEGANLNEICAAVREAVVLELARRVVEDVVEAEQERIVAALCEGKVKGRQALGAHALKGCPGFRCPGHRFRRQGHRSKPRRVRTDLGSISFRVAYVECLTCGKRIAPILERLDLDPRSGHSGMLERVAMEAVSQTSFERGESDIEARGSPPVPRSSSHRWLAGLDLPESPVKELAFGMADGTGFKKWPGQRGHLRAVIGLRSDGKVVPLGCWAGTSWETIGAKVRARLRGEGVQLELFATDGEPELDKHLATIGDHAQRCVWHLPRGLNYALWEDDAHAPLEARRGLSKDLAGLIGVELPDGEWEAISPDDREELRREVKNRRATVEELAREFRARGYHKAAGYLERSLDRLFANVELWLETGVVAPRTTSILENVMRELGRRVKKLGWNWRDPGVAQMSQMVMLRRYDPETWDAWWRERLGLRGRCRITVESIERKAA